MMRRMIGFYAAWICGAALVAGGGTRPNGVETATLIARKLALARIDAIARAPHCRLSFEQQRIDLDLLRATVRKTRFYNSLSADGDLRFSQVVGRAASPDEKLRSLAAGLPADAFVLGFFDGKRYVRTSHVILNRGYFEQEQDGIRRPTTEEEKQALLLHEILHIALDKDDDDLAQRELCPLRLLAFCPLSAIPQSSSKSHRTGQHLQAARATARVHG
jgi:hypothetical protein